jgi:hypothetical protein
MQVVPAARGSERQAADSLLSILSSPKANQTGQGEW